MTRSARKATKDQPGKASDWLRQQVAAWQAAKPVVRLEPLRGDLEAAIAAGISPAQIFAGLQPLFPTIRRREFFTALKEMQLIKETKDG